MIVAWCLWGLNQVLLALVIGFVYVQLRQPYQFWRWTWAWRVLLLAMSVAFVRRCLWMWHTGGVLTVAMWLELSLTFGVSVALAVSFYLLASIFRQPLTLDPQARSGGDVPPQDAGATHGREGEQTQP